jgi:hypothetical protein
MKPLTVLRLTNQPKTVLAPLETVMKVRRENKDYPFTHSISNLPWSTEDKTHTESDGNQWKPGLGNPTEDLRGLTTNGKAKQDARRSIQTTIACGEGAGEDSGVDDVWEDFNPSVIDCNDIWAEGGWPEVGEGRREISHLWAALPVFRNNSGSS